MKRTKLFITLAIMLFGAFTASAAFITSTGTKPSVGNGNSGSPYEIRTAEELRWFVHYENTRHWFPNDHAKLMADIDLSSICGPEKGSWIPLGYPEENGAKSAWEGKLFGNGHTISGLYIDGDDMSLAPAGFCGNIDGVTITDLTIKGQIINAKGYNGGLAAMVSGNMSISNCVSLVDITKDPDPNAYYGCIGGLIGFITANQSSSSSYVTRCSFQGTITGRLTYAGSLIAAHCGEAKVTECSAYSDGKLGLIGSSNKEHTISNCISDKYILYEYIGEHLYPSWAKLRDNIYVDDEYCLKSTTVNADTQGSEAMDASDLANGAACYRMNQKMGGQYFTQTLGTDLVPYPGTKHATVYRVKEYTNCKDFDYAYSNSNEDITVNRTHEFLEGQATCSHCDAPNPASHVHDGEYYTLATKEDVLWFWDMVNKHGVTELKVRLAADIDMERTSLEPLKNYMGEIDGAGHTLANLYVNGSYCKDTGLVGCLQEGGYIHDLTISGSVTANNSFNVGAFTGRTQQGSRLRNLRNDCTVYAQCSSLGAGAQLNLGGITGLLGGSAEACINNGTVVEAYALLSSHNTNAAGIAGFAESGARMRNLANNGVVGVNSYNGTKRGSAIANYAALEQAPEGLYYVEGLKNPGFTYFFSGNSNSGETAIAQTAVGSGELCYRLNEPNEDGNIAFGQTIGIDLMPHPGVSEEHQQVYNKRSYYNCSQYTEYSNLPYDGSPLNNHEYNSDGYCIHCYHVDLPQNGYNIYQVSSAEDWEKFAKAMNAAYQKHASARFASAEITGDITLDASNFTPIGNLWGNIYGQGHSIKFGNAPAGEYALLANVRHSATVSDLNVSMTGSSSALADTNSGTLTACSALGGQICRTNYALISDCYSDQSFPVTDDGLGYMARCLQLTETAGVKSYAVLSKTSGTTECYENTRFAQDQAESGELAYYISHMEKKQPCVWGQELGVDARPRLCYGQTRSSDTFVTSLTTYSVEHPDGIVEYMNAGTSLEAAPGHYKVCSDVESWPTPPAYNFIVDNGDGTYSAEHINLDPTAQHWLPMEVHADKLTLQSVNDAGEFESRKYYTGDIVSLLFPVDMPTSKINGTVYLFDGYDALNNILLFTSALDDDFCVPANTPFLVKAFTGGILTDDLADVDLKPMTAAKYAEQENARHLAGYQQQVLPGSRAIEDGEYVLYYVQNGDKATLATDEASTANQFGSYFRLPWNSVAETQRELNVVLVDSRELATSRYIERDLFSIPYGALDANAEWEKVQHLNTTNSNVFYGNDVTQNNYANISAYEFMYIHGTPGQKYYLYFNGPEATELTIDADGDAFVELDNHRVGIGDVHLRGIRVPEGETLAEDAYARVYKYLEEGLVLSGYGDFADELKGYPFYDATGVKCAITLNLENPNAMVVGGTNIKGVYNRIEKSADVMQGFTAESLRLTDGGDFCYDYSVKCPDVNFTRVNIPAETRYVTFVLPFTVKAQKGMYEYVDCDGSKVYYSTPADGVIAPYLPIVIDMEKYDSDTVVLTGEDFLALSPNGTYNVTPAPSTKYDLKFGFVKRRQANVPLVHPEVVDYNVYGYSLKSYKFVKAKDTFSVDPFRAFFLLPKRNVAQIKGYSAPAEEVSSLEIVIDGQEIENPATGITDVEIGNEEMPADASYNMQGLRVSPNSPGLIIRKGKKTLNRPTTK